MGESMPYPYRLCPKCQKKRVALIKRDRTKGLKYYRCLSCGYQFTETYTNMKLVTVHLPRLYIEALNHLVEKGRYASKSEAIRVAVRDLLAKELWRREEVFLSA